MLPLCICVNGHFFPGKPVLASFIGAKDNGSGGGDSWSYKMYKAPVSHHYEQTNTPFFLQAG